jgi:Colicin V production protein.
MLNILLLDGSIIFLFLLFFIIGARRGFVKSLLSLLNILLSLVISIYVSSKISENIYDKFIKDSVTSQIKTSLDGKNFNSDKLISSLPEFISQSLSYYGITEASLNDIIHSKNSDSAVQIEKVISPIFIHAIKASVQLVLFFAFSIIFGALSKGILTLFNFKILKPIDSSIGAVLGLVTCYFVIVILMFFIKASIQITNFAPDIFSYDNIGSTYIFRYMYVDNIICNLK